MVGAAACGGGTTHASSAHRADRTEPTVVAETLPTTTTAPLPSAPPVTISVPPLPPPPSTAAPQPVVDCLTILTETDAAWQQNLERFPSKQELAQVVQDIGRADCLAAVDSYQPHYQYNQRPITGCDISPNLCTR
jgi:hypothetical protein